ncbi:hypothetical protein AB0395_09430 [Streptosporangium sp. NPDC051023]|uniref:hypothetical protein n=1 Tax=Streptosporangium sp. NPDC051023 TaxID=3155410 RepID=UPI0034501BC2
MRTTLRILGTVCVVQAVGGTLSDLWGEGRGWFLVNQLGFLDGYRIFACIVLGALGLALCVAATSANKE